METLLSLDFVVQFKQSIFGHRIGNTKAVCLFKCCLRMKIVTSIWQGGVSEFGHFQVQTLPLCDFVIFRLRLFFFTILSFSSLHLMVI